MCLDSAPRVAGMGLLILGLLVDPAPCSAQGLFGRFRKEPTMPAHLEPITIQGLAHLIDDLDSQLFEYGQITVKAPDVWGQNRMTQHRAEYEDRMVKELDKFEIILSSYQRRADITALAVATAVGAGPQTQVSDSDNVNITTPTPSNLANLATPAKDIVGAYPISPLLTPDVLTKLALSNSGAVPSIGIEPTVAADQRSRFYHHLQQLRRINIGDDRSDLPGYGLYLARVPVSILPGADSAKGKGAQVTFEAKHHLTPDLLADTFRHVVILDTAYQLTEALTRCEIPRYDPCGVPNGPVRLLDELCTPPKIATTPIPKATNQRFTDAMGSLGIAGLASGVAGTVSPTELVDLYSLPLLDLIRQAVGMQMPSRLDHDPSVMSIHLRELAAVHTYMREQAKRGVSPFLPHWFERIGDSVLSRDYAQLAVDRCDWFREVAELRGEMGDKKTVRPVDAFAFALIVQSALVDRQLKHDMGVIAQRKGCTYGDPDYYCFHALVPDEAAQFAFSEYVAAKWPIHVFALDPAIDQQNQLDLFSQRSELQLALATAVATGQVDIENATSYARRLETDLAAVALNRTAVGFGAGETTFGWRFYPRVQTPPTPGNIRQVGSLLAGTTYGLDYELRNRRIEPGMREAYALMVVPNFVPGIRLTTVTNWFDLQVKHRDQLLETTEMVELGARVQAARNALTLVCDSGRYRPVELEVLDDRITQLEAQLPMQRHDLQLPFEGTLTGSELFSSTAAALGPRLLAWYGEPVHEEQASSVFLYGTGFLVGEMKAIVGGVALKDIDMLSRNVIRIEIPKEAKVIDTGQDGTKPAIDIHVATPNGISNHLLVGVIKKPQSGGSPGAPDLAKTTVTTRSGTAGDGSTTTTTTIESTKPGIILPPGTILPMGTASPLPEGIVMPGSHLGANAHPLLPGLVPSLPQHFPNLCAACANAVAPLAPETSDGAKSQEMTPPAPDAEEPIDRLDGLQPLAPGPGPSTAPDDLIPPPLPPDADGTSRLPGRPAGVNRVSALVSGDDQQLGRRRLRFPGFEMKNRDGE